MSGLGEITSEVEEALRKHAQREIEGMAPDFKAKEYPGMTDPQILQNNLKNYRAQAMPRGNGTIAIYQSRGYFVIDAEGNTVPGEGSCMAD